jgi:hypothetical protein
LFARADDLSKYPAPEGPQGVLSFGSFLWANKENEQKKSIAG